MKPPRRENNFEKVTVGEMINGEISEVQYDQTHKFSYSGKEDICPGVRLVFQLDGYKFNHYSRWMKFSYSEKANLYKKYIVKLVEGAKPDMDFDLDAIKGMRVKTLWTEEGEYQNLDSIFPIGNKLPPDQYLGAPEGIIDEPPDEV